MARRGRYSGLVDALKGFSFGYDTGQRFQKDREIREISEAKPEESVGFTQEQGDELRAAAESGQYDIAYDESKKGYTVTPKADPSQTGVIAQQGVTDFLGKRTAGSMDGAGQNKARMLAMAGVLKKHGDLRGGIEVENQVTNQERDDQRFAREQKQWEREDKQAALDDELRGIEASVGEWTQKRLTNPDGTAREMTPDDHLELGQYHAGQLMKAGRVKEATAMAKQNQEMALGKIQRETAERNAELDKVQAAIVSGDLEAAGRFYDKYVPDGARVSGVTVDPKTGVISIERTDDDGNPLPKASFKNRDELMAGLNIVRDPQALFNFSQNEFRNNLLLRQDNRAAAAEGRAAASAQREVDDRTAKQKAAVALHQQRNPKATPADLEAVRTGVIDAVPKTDTNAPAEVKLAQAYVTAGMAKDMAEGLKLAATTKGDSPEKVRQEIYTKALTANFGDATRAQEATEQAMTYLFPEKKDDKPSGGAGAAPKKGDERVVQAGPNKGKKAVFDGSGWVLK
ncbi:hypothetical protein BN948_01728 [Hydrogenophaga intermedia]|uniref:Uncharacterized protein n=1 Tax=Hydrogenophaga intermedia TaxID=65786 RepID=A0A1L1PBF7_HYDIT|nr:hypothetical protein [Hydrogenophaga intermedia]CDN87308.1 hypothetical protein BN948_01728 [Hydrogenophaga intermedia]